MYQSTMTTQEEAPPPELSTEGDYQIHRKPDGTIDVKGPDIIQARIPKSGDFDENLADLSDAIAGKALAERLYEYYTTDIDSRKDWEKREGRALDMLGIRDTIDAPNDTAPGINRVTHPMLMEATVRFQANAITELFPSGGPAKPKILGVTTPEKQAKADRIEMFLNYYLTEVDRGYFADTDQMLLYLPMSGSAFRKGGQNWVTGMPELRYVKATSFIAPYAGTDLASMPRYAHEYTMSGQDLKRAMVNGMFAEARLTLNGSNNAEHNKTADTADGRLNITHDDDMLYGILEYHIDMELPGDEKVTAAHKDPVRPYIVVIDKEDKNCFLIRRNWREQDPQCKKRMWFAHHKYLPGLGFYGFGLPHVIGSLGNAASGAVNALLDGAQMASFQGGFKTKDNKMAGEIRLEPGVWKDVDASAEDLAKSFYSPPFKEPGQALFHLLDSLVDSGQRFAGTADVAVGDANNNAPVGTTIALIEQSQKPQSAIHKRLHKSFSDELKMFTELVHDFMPDDYEYTIGADVQHLLKSDFNGDIDVVSVTDPNIYSDTQRIQQSQAMMQLVQQNPDLFTPKQKAEVVLRMMRALKIPDIEAVEPHADQPKYVDAVTENGLILAGKGVRAFETQDQAAHIAIHQHGAATAAAAQMDPNTQQAILAAYGVHIRDHMALQYRQQIMAAAGIPEPPLDADGAPVELDPQTEAKITAAVVAKLPPPPPPPTPPAAGPSPADLAQQKLKANDDLHQQKLQQQSETHAAQLKQQADDHAQQSALQKQQLVEEQTRAEAGHREELRRKSELTTADEKRKDALTAAALVREGAKAKVATRTKILDTQAGHRERAVGHHVNLHIQANEARTRLAAMREQAAEKRKLDAQARKDEQAHSKQMANQKVQTGKVGLQQKRQAARIAARKPKAKPKAK